MPLNCGKCKVIHIAYRNTQTDYSLLGNEIESVDQEENNGIIISTNLKFSKPSIKAEEKAQKLIGCTKRNKIQKQRRCTLAVHITSKTPSRLQSPILGSKYSESIQMDIDRQKAVQAMATKPVPTLRQFGYRRRMERLNIFDLQTRRLRAQLIEGFKILKGITNVDYNNLFRLNTNQSRGNGYKLELKRYSTQFGNFFT
ncbi:uncharacterized protein [Palaemon carinicauda]|uniref:uncharacterized protein n=1 Tax=Palaemon carinicauda TaxID=392227 RepID=UPI0035B64121